MILRTLAAAALAAVAAAAVPAGAAAQSYAVDRGSLILDGQASFSSDRFRVDGESVDGRLSILSLAPALQYFVVPGLALGGELLLTRFGADGESSWSYGVGPAATYYFGRGERSIYPFVGTGVMYLGESGDGAPEGWGYNASAGALFMMSRAVGLNTRAFYRLQRRDVADVRFQTDSFGLALGVSAFVF